LKLSNELDDNGHADDKTADVGADKTAVCACIGWLESLEEGIEAVQ